MAKASDRRKLRRVAYFQELVSRDPGRFRIEWNLRVASWAQRAQLAARSLSAGSGRGANRVFQLVDEALLELARIGTAALALEAEETRRTLSEVCCRAVAAQVDPRLFRLNNHSSIQARRPLSAGALERALGEAERTDEFHDGR